MAGWRSWLPLESSQPGQSCHPALPPSTTSHQTKAGAVWALVGSSPGWALHREVFVLPTAPAASAGAAWAGLTSPPAALAVLAVSSPCCLRELEHWDGNKPSFAHPAMPRQRPHSCASEDGSTPELGQGWGRSTCTREGSSWLQAFSKPADINSIFCCLGQKSSPCSCLGSFPAGLAPCQLGTAFLPSSPITSVAFRT